MKENRSNGKPPYQVVQELVLIRSNSIKDFLREDGLGREMLKPYWVWCNGMMVFNYVNERTNKEELEQEIKQGIVFIRDKSEKMNVIKSFR